MQYKFVIPLKPLALQRARHSFLHARPWDPQKAEKLATAIYIQQQKPHRDPLTGPIRIDAFFYFQVPPSRAKKAKLNPRKYMMFRPDSSNLIKFYEDILVDCSVLHDDCIIVVSYYEKLWTEDNPRTEFYLTELES